ncbi:MAG: ATP-grasp domain-containing protein [Pyrinomonadaceae bacterium]
MPKVEIENLNVFLLEETVWITSAEIDVPRYDFAFETFFACRHPIYRSDEISAVGRFGVTDDYADLYHSLKKDGVSLIHTPEQHLLASELTDWYPLLEDVTPRSLWFDAPPSFEEIEKHFSYPIFIKGSRQTSKHKSALSVVNSRAEYEFVAAQFRNDPILRWQSFVCRDLIELRSVAVERQTDKIRPSFEFRTFWWRGECVGSGAYWADFASYSWTETEKLAALKVARKAAERLDVVFLVIDVAQTKDSEWIVIECNDAQESGYAAVSPIALWQNIVEIERARLYKSQPPAAAGG